MHALTPAISTVLGLSLLACSSDPRYMQPDDPIDVAAPGSDVDTATTSFTIPIRLEEMKEAEERTAREAEAGYMIPFVTLQDLDLAIEWSIENHTDVPGVARIHVNGGNEYFAYAPTAFVVDPDEEEEPPPLMGNIPINVPPMGTVTGVFREDELYEAATDLELITRGGMNPFTALLEVHEKWKTMNVGGTEVPRAAFAHMVRFDITFIGNTHMTLRYAVRARDEWRPNRIHDEGIDADPAELTAFAPADFAPALP